MAKLSRGQSGTWRRAPVVHYHEYSGIGEASLSHAAMFVPNCSTGADFSGSHEYRATVSHNVVCQHHLVEGSYHRWIEMRARE
jgi:hypothetical protein